MKQLSMMILIAISLLHLPMAHAQTFQLKEIQPVEVKPIEVRPLLEIMPEEEEEEEMPALEVIEEPKLEIIEEPKLEIIEEPKLEVIETKPELETITIPVQETVEPIKVEPVKVEPIKIEIAEPIKVEPGKTIQFDPATDDRLTIELKPPQLENGTNEEESGKQFEVVAQPEDSCAKLQWGKDQTGGLEFCDKLSVQDNHFKIQGKEKEFEIPAAVDKIYEKVQKEVNMKDANIVDARLLIETDEDGNEEAQYEFEVLEKRKLFWLIPVNITSKIRMGVEDNKVKVVKYGFGGLFFRNRDYMMDIVIAPNLKITNVEMSPKSLHATDSLKLKATITNTGFDSAYAGFTSEGGPSRVALYFGDDIEIQSADTGFFLQPGESETRTFTWTAIMCNAPIKIVADPDNRIEESNEGDNVWGIQVPCAPTNAPDLTVTDVTYAGGMKKIGQPVKLRYRVTNQGSEPSAKASVEFSVGNSRLTSPVKALAPGASEPIEFTYTPENCDGAVLTVDSQDAVTETNEDNNLAYEPASGCRERPDLFVKSVWWKAGGMTSGDIHAGEEMWFRVKAKNDPESTATLNAACVSNLKGAVKLNGNTIKTLDFGKIGCIPANSYSVPDYWLANAEFTYTPKCDGETLTVELDPGNAIAESLESNNVWKMDIICTAAPPIATPN